MIYEINTVDVLPGEAETFMAAFAKAAPMLRTVPGCRDVELLRSIESPDRFQVRVKWVRIENHTEQYPRTEQAAAIRALLLPLMASGQPGHYEVVKLS